MIKKVNQLKSVSQFKVVGDKLFCVIDRKYVYKYSFDGHIEYYREFNFDIGSIYKVDSNTIVCNDDNEGILLNESLNLIKAYDKFNFSSYSEKLKLGISTEWTSFSPIKYKIRLFSVENDEIITELDNLPIRIENDIIIRNTLFGFEILSDKDLTVLCSFDKFKSYKNIYSNSKIQNIDLQRVIGQFNGIVWAVLTNGALIGLSLESGETEYTLQLPTNHPSDMQEFAFAKATNIDSNRGLLLGSMFQHYWEIDLMAPAESYLLYDMTNEFNKYSITIDTPNYERIFDSYFLYFSDSPKGIIGALDRSKREICWIEKITGLNQGIAKILEMKQYNDYLFILDKNKNLNIYLKEKGLDDSNPKISM